MIEPTSTTRQDQYINQKNEKIANMRKTHNYTNSMIPFLFKQIPCTCIIYLLAITTASASPQKKDTKSSKELSKPKIQLTFIPNKTRKKSHIQKKAKQMIPINTKSLNLAFKIALKNKTTNYIDFSKMKPKNKIKQIRERYLTLYSGKKDKLKATYLQGAYAINYIQRW